MKKIIILTAGLMGFQTLVFAQPYLELTGGTLTGGLTATSATFSGDVGIGTTSPGNKLHVVGNTQLASTSNALLTLNNTSSAANGVGSLISFYNTTSDFMGGLSVKYDGGTSGSSKSMQFYTAGNSGTPKMVLTGGGFLGIGTTTPSEKLVIGGINDSDNTNQSSILFMDASENPLGKIGSRRGVNGYDGTLLFFTPNNLLSQDLTEKMRITVSGNVGIGTTIPSEKLAVNGNIVAKEVKVTLTSDSWPDYVFHKNYPLKPLSEVEKFIQTNNHLPEIPSSDEVKKDGLNLGEMNAKLLQKIEELTLYVIELKKSNDSLKTRVRNLENR